MTYIFFFVGNSIFEVLSLEFPKNQATRKQLLSLKSNNASNFSQNRLILLTLSILGFLVQAGIRGGLIQPPLPKICNNGSNKKLLGSIMD